MKEQTSEEQERQLLNRLFLDVHEYRTTKGFRDMMGFCARFPHLSPYNAALIYAQKGSGYVLTSSRWKKYFHREIKDNARPMLILIPFGPVAMVYDIQDTYPELGYENQNKQIIMEQIAYPYAVRGQSSNSIFARLLSNLDVYGIRMEGRGGEIFSSAGLRYAEEGTVHLDVYKSGYRFQYTTKARYQLTTNLSATLVEIIAGVCHELGHYFCQHIKGESDGKEWWRQRMLTETQREFEAECVAYIVCNRFGIHLPSERYLNYISDEGKIPYISIELVMKAAGQVEKMMKEHIPYSDGYLYKYDKKVAAEIDGMIKRLKAEHKARLGALWLQEVGK